MVDGLTLIMPVYNEASILTESVACLLKLLQTGQPFELIIGSNGSTDGTREIGTSLAAIHPEIRFFHLDKRGAVGRVFKRAVREARYDKLICLDADLTIDLAFVSRARGELDRFDLVIGSKKAGREDRTWWRRWGSDLYIRGVRSFLRLEYSDYSIGAKAYRKNAVLPFLDSLEDGTAYVLTLALCLHRSGHPVTQIPVDCEDRRGSRFNLTKEGMYRFAHLAVLALFRRFRCRKAGSASARTS